MRLAVDQLAKLSSLGTQFFKIWVMRTSVEPSEIANVERRLGVGPLGTIPVVFELPLRIGGISADEDNIVIKLQCEVGHGRRPTLLIKGLGLERVVPRFGHPVPTLAIDIWGTPTRVFFVLVHITPETTRDHVLGNVP